MNICQFILLAIVWAAINAIIVAFFGRFLPWYMVVLHAHLLVAASIALTLAIGGIHQLYIWLGTRCPWGKK